MKASTIALVAAAALAGCSSGPGLTPMQQAARTGPETVTAPSTQNYIGLLAAGAGDQRIEGFGFNRSDITPDGSETQEVLYIVGRRDPATGQLIITDRVRLMDDQDGLNGTAASPSYSDTVNSNPRINAQPIGSQSGVYAAYGSFGDTASSFTGSSDVIYGVTTDAGDMPTTGTATYTASSGNAIRVIRGAGLTSTVSTGTLTANFGAGTVDMSVFPASAASGFDEVRATGLAITGNSFYGEGTTTLRNLGTDVTATVLGTVNSSRAGGFFFGPAGPNPAEAGGVMKVEGTNLNVSASMIGQ